MNVLGLIISYLFIIIIMLISKRLVHINKELSRKFIHIGVSNWWIIATIFFDNWIIASIVPTSFIIINYLSYKKNIIDFMEREEKSLGTVYYALSCLILTIFSISTNNYLFGAIGMLIMGYGDGFAAIIGNKYKILPYKIFNQTKTISGTITMYLFSLILTIILLSIYNDISVIKILLIPFIATILEAFSPKSIDNLTVPLLTPLLLFII